MIKGFKIKLAVMLICVVGSLTLVAAISNINKITQPICRQTDALILLAGNYSGKADVVAKLFHNGVAGKILLTNDGVKSKWSRKHQRNLYNVEWTEEELVTRGVPRTGIVQLGFRKSGTIHDALAVRDYVLNHGIKSVTLVTFDFHASRAYWAFSRVFRGTTTLIQVHSIETKNNGAITRLYETMKYGFYLFRYGLVGPPSAMAAKKVSMKSSNSPSILKTSYGSLQIFPGDNPWNQDISKHPVHPDSQTFINSIGSDKPLHPDFGTEWEGATIGIPYVVVSGNQVKVPVRFQYAAESDSGPYPIPPDVPIEGGVNGKGDRHIVVVDYHNKRLYELFDAYRIKGGWRAGSGAIYDLTSNSLRPAGWTSADAAGLPIFPGLVRYDEVVEQKEIRHALRFTVLKTQRAYIKPARHFASNSTDRNLPPMGLRVRLKADFEISSFPSSVQVILEALKKYGMILADNGGDWFISGVPNALWKDDDLHWIKKVKGSDFEVVYTGEKETY